MGTFSIWHWLVVLVVVLVLFGGKGKISALMGDFGKGLKSFKKGMADDAVADKTATPGDDARVINSADGDTAEMPVGKKDADG